MRILLTGASGQLGKAFLNNFTQRNVSCYSFDHQSFDIHHQLSVEKLLKQLKPQVFINCAAYNLVDEAESCPPKAYLTNAHSVGNLAKSCTRLGIKLVHFSSDYIFDGRSSRPYRETDKGNPLNVYGRSKLLGERLLEKSASNYLIFRTSWVYGEGNQNFIRKLFEWSKRSELLRVADDEVSVPTSTQLLARVTIEALEKGLQGLYHLVPSGHCSRFEWAQEIFKLMKIKKKIHPTKMSSFRLTAERGCFLALDNSQLAQMIFLPSWQEELRSVLESSLFKR